MPFFSVLIPLYNKENFVQRTLKSLLEQKFKDFEIIIVNDGSTDKSLEIVKSLKTEKINLLNQQNQGVAAARNNGVEVSKGKWIAFLDADDIWKPEHLQELKNCIDELPKAELVSNAYKIKLERSFIKTPVYSKNLSEGINYIDNYLEYSFIDPLFWTSSIAVKKEIFEALEGFDEDLKTGEDLDFMIRFSQKYKIGYNPTHTITYNRITENNLSDAHTLLEKKKYIDKHQKEEGKNPQLKKYLDINRYSLALQAKMNQNKELFQQTLSEINPTNLNSKQSLLIKFPGFALNLLKKIQRALITAGIYKSAFS